jgi:hypothetical protein
MHLFSAKTKSPGSNTLVSTNQKTKLFEYGLQHNLVVHSSIDIVRIEIMIPPQTLLEAVT